jgi:predicted nucleic acid-binding protein
MDTEEKWIASELVKTEMLLALRHGSVSSSHYDAIARSFRSDWESFYVIPIDSKCLNRAAQFGAQFGLKVLDAIHLASIDRIPRPFKYLTFDHAHISAAVELGIEVIAPTSNS